MRHGQPHWVRENTEEFDLETESTLKAGGQDCQVISETKLHNQDDEVQSLPSPEYFQRFVTSLEDDQFVGYTKEEAKSPMECQDVDLLDQLLSSFGIPSLEDETFEMLDYLENQKDLFEDEKIVWSIIQQKQSLREEAQNSMDLFQPKDCDSSNQDDENEQFHYEHLMHIPNPPCMGFTVEEKLCVERLVQIDQESRVALKDTMESFGCSIMKQVRFILDIINIIKLRTNAPALANSAPSR